MVAENSRQTPFAKCTARWFAPIRVGDQLTSSASVIDKYERRGSKFVTFQVDISNQNSEKVAEFDYTCIFEYSKGQNLS
jgi:acyl dehydratase